MTNKLLYSMLGVVSAILGLTLTVDCIPAVNGDIIFANLSIPFQLTFGFMFFSFGAILLFKALTRNAKRKKH